MSSLFCEERARLRALCLECARNRRPHVELVGRERHRCPRARGVVHDRRRFCRAPGGPADRGRSRARHGQGLSRDQERSIGAELAGRGRTRMAARAPTTCCASGRPPAGEGDRAGLHCTVQFLEARARLESKRNPCSAGSWGCPGLPGRAAVRAIRGRQPGPLGREAAGGRG
jgi:hypothetical protein